MKKEISRRDFIHTLMASLAIAPAMASVQKDLPGGIPLRQFGNTNEWISIIGYGGWDSVVNKTDDESIKLMHEALDNGITFYDNAWEYNNGRSEEVMGKAFAESSKRDKIFLMTKVCARDYKGAVSQLNDSLRRLQTDRVDLLQFHSIQYNEDAKRIFDPENGALKAVMEFKKQGKIRYVGFSGHMYIDSHLEMLNMDFDWNSVMMPLNLLDPHYKSFEKNILPVLIQRNIAPIGMKSLASNNGRIPRELKIPAELCRAYVLSLPVSTLVCGIQTRKELLTDLSVARDFKPLTSEKINELLEKTQPAGITGNLEAYKDPKGYFGCSHHARALREEG
ncbi:MAG: aldo/keto reductase [Cyclobacteriaceae bacterium]|nr:aldo/keto reductase [Cyclobacteriaceae bacterium]